MDIVEKILVKALHGRRVVCYDQSSVAQLGLDKLQRWQSKRRPDLDRISTVQSLRGTTKIPGEHTVQKKQINRVRLLQFLWQGLQQVALQQLDPGLHLLAGLLPVLLSLGRLALLLLRCDDLSSPARRHGPCRLAGDVLANRQGEVDGRHAEAGTGLDDVHRPGGAGEQVDEVALVGLQGDELVAHEVVEARRPDLPGEEGADVPAHGEQEHGEAALLGAGLGMERVEQAQHLLAGHDGAGSRGCHGQHESRDYRALRRKDEVRLAMRIKHSKT